MAGDWGGEGTKAPQTMADLYKRAQGDLATPQTGQLLYWCFLNAKLVGQLAATDRELVALEQQERDARDALMRTYPPTAQQLETIRSFAQGELTLRLARDKLAEATSLVRATEHVMKLVAAQAPAEQPRPTNGVRPRAA